jgi:hypothetical protein
MEVSKVFMRKQARNLTPHQVTHFYWLSLPKQRNSGDVAEVNFQGHMGFKLRQVFAGCGLTAVPKKKQCMGT